MNLRSVMTCIFAGGSSTSAREKRRKFAEGKLIPSTWKKRRYHDYVALNGKRANPPIKSTPGFARERIRPPPLPYVPRTSYWSFHQNPPRCRRGVRTPGGLRLS